MDTILQAMFSGVAIGLVYGLPALAIVLLWNTAGFFNLAQGECLAFSTFVLYQFYIILEWNFWISVFVTLVIMPLVGLLLNLIIFNPLRKFKARELYVLITTIAIGIFLKNLIRLIWGSKPLSITTIWPKEPLSVLGSSIMPSALVILGVCAVLVVALYILSQKTRFGIAMRAASENKVAASLMGIQVDFVIGMSFALSLFITAVAGILSTSVLYLIPEMGDSIGLKAFAATIIGGFGNPAGAIIGGILIGVIETFVSFVLPASIKDGITFMLLIIFLLFKPTGIFLTEDSSKV